MASREGEGSSRSLGRSFADLKRRQRRTATALREPRLADCFEIGDRRSRATRELLLLLDVGLGFPRHVLRRAGAADARRTRSSYQTRRQHPSAHCSHHIDTRVPCTALHRGQRCARAAACRARTWRSEYRTWRLFTTALPTKFLMRLSCAVTAGEHAINTGRIPSPRATRSSSPSRGCRAS